VTRRAPSSPPELDGYTVTKLLGSGGFADVYLYEQRLPRRPVAVKVLVPGAADGELLAQFDAEANLMAALSTHPAIVTIHQAGIAADGRPYLVMEYCSRPNLSVRYRADRMSVAEVLRIGVRLSGAVETAHRAGILHRDIKPANVLTTDFGHPALTDFGISVHSAPSSVSATADVAPASVGGTVGMSIPWTAPEVFAEGAGGDEHADSYALAATLYTVLARRSPFDRPGGPNGSADLINRIRSRPVPPIGRADVPPSLERVLTRAMDKNPAARYPTALDLGRALQQVETELRLAPTPVDVLDEDAAAAELRGSDPVAGLGTPATRIRSLTVVDPQPEPMPHGPLRPGQPYRPEDTTRRIAAEGAVPMYRPPPVPLPGPPPENQDTTSRAALAGQREPARQPVRWMPILLGAGVLVAVTALVLVVIGLKGTEPPSEPGIRDTITRSAPGDPIGAVVPVPTRLSGAAQGARVVFTWANPEPQPGDAFVWYRTEQGAPAQRHRTTEGTASVIGAGRVCVAVLLVRDDGATSAQPANACAGGQ
jgi:eukaryotic-like serine/threonine-protein kinase